MPIREGDRVYILLEDGRDYLVRVERGKSLGTHLGNIDLGELSGREFGEYILTTSGKKAFSPPAWSGGEHFPHAPEDPDCVPQRPGVHPPHARREGRGSGDRRGAWQWRHVWGAGPACGGRKGRSMLTSGGKEFIVVAKRNLEEWRLLDRVVIRLRDIEEGFEEREVDALFLDVS
jgi:tRNA (adenine57-N1/adenine58-N1)-methyltransferase